MVMGRRQPDVAGAAVGMRATYASAAAHARHPAVSAQSVANAA